MDIITPCRSKANKARPRGEPARNQTFILGAGGYRLFWLIGISEGAVNGEGASGGFSIAETSAKKTHVLVFTPELRLYRSPGFFTANKKEQHP
jgi:hypothetical protein